MLKKIATFSDLKNFKDIFRKKTHIFFQKNLNFERFENSHYSSRVLRQICHNLVKKIFTFRKASQHRFQRELNWQTSGKKTHSFERKILLSIF